MPLPDEGVKLSALPEATSADAIDLVGVQAGVTKKLASTLLATQAELDAETTARTNADALKANDNAVVHLAGAETITGAKTFSASETPFGLGAAGAAGTYVSIGSLGDAANVWLDARGTPVDIGINLRPKGAGATSLKAGDLAIDAGTLRLFAVHVRTTTANAGTSGAPPAQVDGYISVRMDGVIKKIPYYVA